MSLKQDVADALASLRHPTGLDLREEVERSLSEARSQSDDQWIESQLAGWLAQFPKRRVGWESSDAGLADLRLVLLGEPLARRRPLSRLSQAASWVFDHYIALASLFAVIATVFYGLAYARIYDAVDITPEEAGFGPTQVLTHAAVGGLALLILVSLFIFCACLPGAPLRDDPQAAIDKGEWSLLALNASLTFAAILFICSLGALANVLAPALVFSALAVLVLAAVSFRLPREASQARIEPRPLRFSTRRYLVLFSVLALPGGLFMTGVVTFGQAGLLGQRLEFGESVSGSKFAGIPFLGIRAEPALVSWRSPQPVDAEVPRCVLYLGIADGNAVLYDHRSHTTFHVPSSEILLAMRTDLHSCDAPVNVRRPSIHVLGNGALACRRGSWESFLIPRFKIAWIAGGVPIYVGRDHRFGHTLRPGILDAWNARAVHCRVTASTAEGEESAVSRPALLDEHGRAVR